MIHRAVEPLLKALYPDPGQLSWMEHAVAQALVKLRDDRGLHGLIEYFREFQRSDIATVLGNYGDCRAVDALIEAMEYPCPHVRFYVARALGKIGDEKALQILSRAVQEDREPIMDTKSLRGKSVAYVAARAIEAIRGKQGR